MNGLKIKKQLKLPCYDVFFYLLFIVCMDMFVCLQSKGMNVCVFLLFHAFFPFDIAVIFVSHRSLHSEYGLFVLLFCTDCDAMRG